LLPSEELSARKDDLYDLLGRTYVVKSTGDGTVEVLEEVTGNVCVVDVFLALVDGRKRSSHWCSRRSRLRICRSHSHTVRSAMRSAVRGTVGGAERCAERSTARRANRSILDLACTSNTLVDQRLVEFLLHIASSTRHTDINTSLSSIARIDAVGDSVAANVDRLQVTTRIVDSTFDNKSGTTLSDENVVVGFRAGRTSGGRLDRRVC
jgi:hypothetical protein